MIFNDTSDTSAVDELWFIQTAHEVPSGRTNAQQRALLELHATRVVKDSEVGDRVIHTNVGNPATLTVDNTPADWEEGDFIYDTTNHIMYWRSDDAGDVVYHQVAREDESTHLSINEVTLLPISRCVINS